MVRLRRLHAGRQAIAWQFAGADTVSYYCLLDYWGNYIHIPEPRDRNPTRKGLPGRYSLLR